MGSLVFGVAQIATDVEALTGTAATTYKVRFHVRAITALQRVSGGARLGTYVVQGGTPLGEILSLAVSSPAATFYLNATDEVLPNGNVALDYYVELPVAAGATLTLTMNNLDDEQWRGGVNDELLEIDGATYDGIICRVSPDLMDTGPTSISKGGGVREWVWSGFAENIYAKGAEK